MDRLIEAIRAAVLDPGDVQLLLESECGGGSIELGGWREFRTPGRLSEVYARAKFKRGVIKQLQIGPGLKREGEIERLLEKAKESAAPTYGYGVAHCVLFASRPLRGGFQWRDALRLSPCPSETPIGTALDLSREPGLSPARSDGPPYPMLLEVRFQKSTIGLIESNRMLRELDRAQHWIAALVAGHIGTFSLPLGKQWVLMRSNERIENQLVQPGFSSGLDGVRDDFLSFDGPPAVLYAGEDYYNRIWVQDDALLLPSSLATDLDHAAALSPTDAAAFHRACYWFSLGIQHRNEISLSMICFATAIESLLPHEKNERCPQCNKPKVGPTQLFKRHLKKYAGVISELEASRDKLYGARCELVHGLFASRCDVGFFSSHDEQMPSLLIEHVAQLGIVNWLRDRAPFSEGVN